RQPRRRRGRAWAWWGRRTREVAREEQKWSVDGCVDRRGLLRLATAAFVCCGFRRCSSHAEQSFNQLTQHTGQGDSSKAPAVLRRTVEDRNSYSSDQYLIGKGQGDMAKGRII